LVGSLAFAFAFTLPPGLFRVGLRHLRARAGRKRRQLAVKIGSNKDPEASRAQRSWYISCENGRPHANLQESGEMELHRSFHGCALHTTTPLRSCARAEGQVGASFQGLGSGRSTARCAVAWGVVVALSADVAPVVVVEEFGVRSDHHHCCSPRLRAYSSLVQH
jgi:hypothetical protein